MIKLMTDTSALIMPKDGKEMGLDVLPLCVSINGKTYQEFVEMNSETFLKEIAAGNIPSSSQPPIGQVIEIYEKYPEDEIVNICMADGLSGTYLSAVGAKSGLANHEHIHVLNTKTLCGPHMHLVKDAIKAIQNDCTLEELMTLLGNKIETVRSFLMPQDFEFLKRGGRLTPLAAKVSGLLKIQPVLAQTPDGTRLEKLTIARTFSGAVNSIIKEFATSVKDPENYHIYISHADVLAQAKKVKESFVKQFPQTKIDILDLSPAFITQGGPGCIAVQWILE